MKPRKYPTRGFKLTSAFCLSIALSSGAATINWTNSAGGSWNVAANWDPNHVPGSDDAAIIGIENAKDPFTVILSANVSVAGLTLGAINPFCADQALSLNGKSFTVNGPVMVREGGQFFLDSGTLIGGHDALISGTITWSDGILDGDVTLDPQGVLLVTGAAAKTHELYGALTNFGTIKLITGDLDLQGNHTGVLVNGQGGLIDLQTNLTIYSYNSRGTLFNWGTLRKSGGDAAATVRPRLFNYAVVETDVGKLVLTGGGTLNQGSSLNGPATTELAGGLFAVNGTVTASKVELTGANLTGTNGLLAGEWDWKDGAFLDGSTLTVATNGALRLSGAQLVLYGMLTNAGIISLESGSLTCQGNAQGLLINRVGAQLQVRDDTVIHDYNNRGALVNFGIVRKTGTGLSTLQLAVQSYGTFEVQTGTLSYAERQFQLNTGTKMTGAGANLFGTGIVILNGEIETGNLVLGGAMIRGFGTLSGRACWTAGRLEDGAVLTVGTNSTLAMNGADPKIILGVLRNQGSILFSGVGKVAMGSLSTMAAIDNQSGATFETSSDAPIAWTGYSQPSFTNNGTFRKSSGVGTTLFDGVVLHNAGTIDVQTGTVAYIATGSAFQDGSRFLGPGTNLLAGGNIQMNGEIYSENLVLGGSALLGTNILSGKIDWIKGDIQEGTHVTVASNGSLILAGPDNKGNAGVIDNQGKILVCGTGMFAMGSRVGQSIIYNRAGALFDLASDAPMGWTSGSPPVITNAGVFRKSAGIGMTVLNGIIFENSGTVDSQAGGISFNATGSIFGDGTHLIGAGTNRLTAGTIFLDGAIYSDNLEFGGARIEGTNRLSGKIDWRSGEISERTLLTVAPDGLLQIEGAEQKALTGVIDNQGTIVLSGTGLLGMGSKNGSSWINNSSGATFEFTANTPMKWTAFATPVFTNAGTLRKSGSSATTVLDGILFHNTGAIDVEAGTLAFNTTGTSFDDGSHLIGSGTNLLYKDSISLNGAIYSDNLLIAGASIRGTCRLTGAIDWTAGEIATPAVITVATNGTLRIGGPDLKAITGVLNNEGAVQLTGGGTLAMGSQAGLALIINRSGATFETFSDAPIAWTAFEQPGFTNAGTFRKSGGTNVTLLNGVAFRNTGTVEVKSGSVGFNATGTSFASGSRFLGPGTNLLLAGVITLNGSLFSENLQIAGATIIGNSLLGGTVSWTAGLIPSEGVVTVATNGILQIMGSEQKTIIGMLNNQGLIHLSGTGTLGMGSQVTMATINNEASGLFEATSAAPIAWTGLSQPLFANAGRFRKSDPTTTLINVPFVNPGVVDVAKGAISLAGIYSLAGGTINFGISSPTDCGQIYFASGATLSGRVSANLLGGFEPRVGDSFPVMAYAGRSGVFSETDFPSCAAWQTNYEATTFRLQVLNARPTLVDVPPQQVDELRTLTVTNAVSHADHGLQSLVFSLASAPQGMGIDPASGTITWTPAQTQSPSTNVALVCVADSGTPPLSSSNSFLVVVREVNIPPVLPILNTQLVDELTMLRVTNTATEPNIHSVTAGYSLLKAPLGSTIDQAGIITWVPSQEQSPSTNLVVTVVTNANPYDLSNPSLAATNLFKIVVREVNVAPVLQSQSTQYTYELSLFTLTNAATESNIHSSLGYLLDNPPKGMTISPSGVIVWVPSHAQAPSTNLITTVATNANPFDLIHPSLSATNRFILIVYERPKVYAPEVTAGGYWEFTFMTIEGQTYTLQYSTDLKTWISKSTFEGYGGPLTIKDPGWEERPACFYRVQVVQP